MGRLPLLRTAKQLFEGISAHTSDDRSWADFALSRRRVASTAPSGSALGPTLSATPASAALGYHEVVGAEFVAIPTAGRGYDVDRPVFLSEQRDY